MNLGLVILISFGCTIVYLSIGGFLEALIGIESDTWGTLFVVFWPLALAAALFIFLITYPIELGRRLRERSEKKGDSDV